MRIKFKKGQAALLAMVLALGAAVFINWYYTAPQAAPSSQTVTSKTETTKANLGDAQYVSATTASSDSAGDERFAAFRVERENAHAKAQAALEKVIQNTASGDAAIQDATKSLESLSKAIKQENDLETLISAKTGSPCIVIMTDDTVKVVTLPGTLTDTVTMQIKELILNQGGAVPENITIFEMNAKNQ